MPAGFKVTGCGSGLAGVRLWNEHHQEMARAPAGRVLEHLGVDAGGGLGGGLVGGVATDHRTSERASEDKGRNEDKALYAHGLDAL